MISLAFEKKDKTFGNYQQEEHLTPLRKKESVRLKSHPKRKKDPFV